MPLAAGARLLCVLEHGSREAAASASTPHYRRAIFPSPVPLRERPGYIPNIANDFLEREPSRAARTLDAR